MRRDGGGWPVAVVGLLLAAPAGADDAVFAVEQVDVEGRVLAAEIADFDGDGDADLMAVSSGGMPIFPTCRTTRCRCRH